jgi:UTP--glucose-1-phosphate uridylyltransferase
MTVDVDPQTRAILDRFGFDEQRFELLREKVSNGELSAASNVLRGCVEPPRESDLTPMPAPRSGDWARMRDVGLEALAAGRVAQVVLAGGMATRFGGVVKGSVEALAGRSFLEWKLGETARLAAELGVSSVPVAVMTSFATDAATRAHVVERRLPEPLWFSQFVSLRLTVAGELFRDDAGSASLHGPGHGDLFEALTSSGTLGRLRGLGVEHVAVSNLDNLGARLDPVVIGAHLLGRRPVTIEVASKDGDVGGAPARVDGRPMLVEGPRFPPDFDQSAIPVFNTNSAVLSIDALAGEYDLTWLYVERLVAGRVAVQLERLYHEVTAAAETTYLVVPRVGPPARPASWPGRSGHAARQPELSEMLAASVLD